MTVAVSCNLSDGVVLGVDSAVTLSAPGGSVAKTYENAEKLFQLGDRSIGVAVFGLATLGNRSIGSYIREFEVKDPQGVVSGDTSIEEVAKTLHEFLFDRYKQTVVPALEKSLKKSFDDIPRQQCPVLGIVAGGFSAKEYLSEVWEISIPGKVVQRRDKGQFGGNWFAEFKPIQRYFKGYDTALLQNILKYFKELHGKPLSADQLAEFRKLVGRHEYQVPFSAMPMEEGVCHVRFLVDLVINHFRFTFGAPVVGGRVRIGKVSYRGEKFEIIENP